MDGGPASALEGSLQQAPCAARGQGAGGRGPASAATLEGSQQ